MIRHTESMFFVPLHPHSQTNKKRKGGRHSSISPIFVCTFMLLFLHSIFFGGESDNCSRDRRRRRRRGGDKVRICWAPANSICFPFWGLWYMWGWDRRRAFQKRARVAIFSHDRAFRPAREKERRGLGYCFCSCCSFCLPVPFFQCT